MKAYIVCCGVQGRAVLFGRSATEPVAGGPIRLTDARMVLFWDAACGGLLGLAAGGPKGETQITRSVPSHGDEAVRQWLEVPSDVIPLFDAWKAV